MRQKKRLLSAVALVASLGLVAAACGSDSDEDSSDTTAAGGSETTAAPVEGETTAPAGGGEGTKVGLLFDITGRGDKSFNDAAAAGLDKAVTELGVVGTESTPTGDGDRAERLKLLVDDGNGLVIGVGFLWTTRSPPAHGPTRTRTSPSSTRVVDAPDNVALARSSPRSRARSSSAPPRR